jgi:hypothetical protein
MNSDNGIRFMLDILREKDRTVHSFSDSYQRILAKVHNSIVELLRASLELIGETLILYRCSRK